ncbi:hydantoinase/oxoprolinase family protein [Virgibacillus dakarensis]|uniref:5-oxoprolinase n=1 Tax=Lentibacillus populi TaxID=1827502 RepID=A0A9W5X6N8_9BACI|nr:MULTISPECIES: hydantoinase/oxoprolinase family protein [Bacillaceae]MBT2215486.1 hydantoinase/oxoprolinase family protein [Virgibacillus dakarensis]MTW86225.1 hydantoinase/oxoprolinase family protein [Virgibacillus dakarensis]GGB52673.1 5-oxoprolinase [Lentibacillus populi]
MRVATDIGGTFTDLIYIDNEGNMGFDKAHSTPPNFENGIIDVIDKSGISFESIDMFFHGSTVVINTLTERKGAKVGLITTKGIRDVLEIARGNRPDLYNFKYEKPKPFVERYLRKEVEERMDYKGEVLQPLNKQDVIDIVDYFKQEKVEAIAVCLLHAYKNPIHEQEVVRIVQAIWPGIPVSASSEITKEWREYERTNTAVLNSYVKPILNTYINNLSNRLSDHHYDGIKYIMQSNGGVTTFESAKDYPINLVESGPVAGIYGAAVLGEMIGESNIIAFDIGGTTAKCSLINNGEVRVTTDYYIERSEKGAGYPIKAPVVDIVEIGNGGGSIAWIDELGSLKVGPQSAGSNPGPVCYGQGGEQPTTTDANLLVGRLSEKNFDYQVNKQPVNNAIKEVVADKFTTTTEEAALGIIEMANSNMLNALKLISVRKGYNPSEFTMIAFGGGGPMHAAELARNLGMKKVIVPFSASVFSAWGMLMTDIRHDYIQTYLQKLNRIEFNEINNLWNKMEQEALEQYTEENIQNERVIFNKFVDLRYEGQEHTVKVPITNDAWDANFIKNLKNKFHELHEQSYTFILPDAEVEIVNLHLTGFGQVEKHKLRKLEETGATLEETTLEYRNVYFRDQGWVEIPIHSRNLLDPSHVVMGPAIIEESTSSTLILDNQKAEIDAFGNIIIEIEVEKVYEQ